MSLSLVTCLFKALAFLVKRILVYTRPQVDSAAGGGKSDSDSTSDSQRAKILFPLCMFHGNSIADKNHLSMYTHKQNVRKSRRRCVTVAFTTTAVTIL